MKSRTSFFNLTVLRKDITRFAPVWALYGIFSCLFVLLMWESDSSAARFVTNAPDLLQAMGALNFVYAALVSLLLFSDLFTSRMCNALHALPMRRESWFLTHMTAGLLFSIVPNLVSGLLAAALLGEYCYGAFLWLAVMTLQYLFFFGVGCFAAQCAGNRIGAIAVYGIFNFLAVIAAFIGLTFYTPLLYGIEVNFEDFALYSPVVRFSEARYLDFHYDNMTDTAVFDGYLGADWIHLGIAAGIGAALLAVSVLLYRKRQLESAGDMISFRPASPVFLVIYTLCVGAVLYWIAELAAPVLQYIFLFIGLAIGFFTGKMLLERKVRVFGGKALAFFSIFLAVFAASIGLTALDPAGITRYVPEVSQVESAEICMSHYYYDRNNDALSLTDPADIQDVQEIHNICLKNRYDDKDLDYRTEAISIRYRLTDGRVVDRLYWVDPEGTEAELLKPLLSRPEAVFGTDDPESLLDALATLEVYSVELDIPMLAVATSVEYSDISWYLEKYGDDKRVNAYYIPNGKADEDPALVGLFEAMKKDCEAGNMAQSWSFHRDEDRLYSITIQSKAFHEYYGYGYTTNYRDIQIYEECEHTIAYLNQLTIDN